MEFGHQLMTGSSLSINFANQRLDVVKNKNSHGFLFKKSSKKRFISGF
jgi:hypothetical protein